MHHDANVWRSLFLIAKYLKHGRHEILTYNYSNLTIYWFAAGSLAAKVYISQNITGLLGNNYIQLTCSLINAEFERTSSVQFFIKNKTDEFDLTQPIAVFEPSKPSELLSPGNYLNGRVTLTNITELSTNATLIFYVLKCEDEKDYMCTFNYKLLEGGYVSEISSSIKISVQGKNYLLL